MDLSINSHSTLNTAANNRPPPPPKEAGGPSTDELLSFLDSDTSGELSADEIAADSGLSQIITHDAFASADADGNGSLTAQELEITRPLGLHDSLQDGLPTPPPSALSELASSSTTGTAPGSLFESLLEITSTDDTTDFAASIKGAMVNAQNMYDLMQDLFSSATA